MEEYIKRINTRVTLAHPEVGLFTIIQDIISDDNLLVKQKIELIEFACSKL